MGGPSFSSPFNSINQEFLFCFGATFKKQKSLVLGCTVTPVSCLFRERCHQRVDACLRFYFSPQSQKGNGKVTEIESVSTFSVG